MLSSPVDVGVRDLGELTDQRGREEDEPDRDLVEAAQLAPAGEPGGSRDVAT
jgi:hypothetical protein